jgi:SAM-dependent methyltransferase
MFKVLPAMADNLAIRRKMESSGLSFIVPPLPRRWWNRLPFRRRVPVGDVNKSWDVFGAAQIINELLEHDDPILDMGAFSSEILLILRAMGFSDLHGIDLNPRIKRMPFGDEINFHTGSFYETNYPDQSFCAITSISAIEHGCDIDRLLMEVARLLKPGGLFIASTDYWPHKIDTDGIRMFDLDWTIFSEQEIRALFDKAAGMRLEPVGDCHFETDQRPISCAGKDYTFALLALRKGS